MALGAASATGAVVAAGEKGWPFAVVLVVSPLGIALGPRVGRLAAQAALVGTLVLLYGFANVGIPGGVVGVPLTEVLLLVGLVAAVGDRRGPVGRRAVRWWVALLGLAALRLVVDAPRFGLLAIRDALMPVEAGFLVLGYRLGRTGAEGLVRWLRWVFLACAISYALYPAREILAAAGPIVGIQRPVPLLGQYAGAGPAAIAGCLFMLLLRPFGRWSLIVAGLFIGELLMFQGRGDYLALATALALLMGLGGPGGRLARVRRRIAGGVVVAALLAAVVFPLAPVGRIREVSPEFYLQHVATLFGREGPGAGTIRDRLSWYRHAWEQVRAAPYGPILGVGYGADLTGGFTVAGGVSVRQPHNDYLEVFARTGILGLVVFVGLLASLFVPLLRAARDPVGAERRFLWWATGTIVAYLVVSAAQPLLAFPYGAVPLFTFAGAGLGALDPRLTAAPHDRADPGR